MIAAIQTVGASPTFILAVANLVTLVLGWVYIAMRVNIAVNALTENVAEMTKTVVNHGERIASIESVCELMCRGASPTEAHRARHREAVEDARREERK